MKKTLTASLLIVLAFSSFLGAQSNGNSNARSATNSAGAKTVRKRGPIFRANKDQIMQAQAILKQRGFYNGAQTGKLDPETRVGLKKYQEAEKLKVTGTLNRATLEKMNITLTDKQKAI